MSHSFVAEIEKSLLPYPQNIPLFLGLSGGIDSVVLLHLLVHHFSARKIIAIHVNHCIAAQADEWQQFCAKLCHQWQVELVAKKVVVDPHGVGLEMAAREARHQVYQEQLVDGGLLLLAHHANDQQETQLQRLLRGSGPTGLGAMSESRRFGRGWLLRPILTFTRSQLEEYALQHALLWVSDPSNADPEFDRNFLRLNVLPLINQRWPGAVATMNRSAELCRENEQLLQSLAQIDVESLALQKERMGVSILLAPMRSWTLARQFNLLRWLCHHQGLMPPTRAQLEEIGTQILTDCRRQDSQAVVRWGCHAVCVQGERAYLLASQPQPLAGSLVWDGVEPLLLPGGGRLQIVAGGNLKWNRQPLTVRPRVAGERSHPHGRRHSQKVKRLLQEYGLEAWLRHSFPMLCQGDQLLAAGDLWVEKPAYTANLDEGFRVVWQPSSGGK